jgi:phospholipid/cholesterol/gamma-HCH transport system ATP-binding protein
MTLGIGGIFIYGISISIYGISFKVSIENLKYRFLKYPFKKYTGKRCIGNIHIMTETILEIQDLVTEINGTVLHRHLDLTVQRGDIVGIVGGSGSGKSVLLRVILGLMPAKSGCIKVFGLDAHLAKNIETIHRRCAVLFQSGALFSSLTVAENIQLPMHELAHLDPHFSQELTFLKLAMVGLSSDVARQYPAELSGGMVKRVALARALAVDAELVFLDEPTAGLDPIAAASFDELLKTLHHSLNLTVVMITHDLDSLYAVCSRVAVLIDQKMVTGTIPELLRHPHPWIQDYFQGPRGRAIMQKV